MVIRKKLKFPLFIARRQPSSAAQWTANTFETGQLHCPRVGVEAAVAGDWTRWISASGEFVGMTGFGASAPASVLYREFGIMPEAVAVAAMRSIARSRIEGLR